MFAAVARYLVNVAGSAGTLLVLDDLHWAVPDALDLLQALVRTPADRPLRLLGGLPGYGRDEPGPPGVPGGRSGSGRGQPPVPSLRLLKWQKRPLCWPNCCR